MIVSQEEALRIQVRTAKTEHRNGKASWRNSPRSSGQAPQAMGVFRRSKVGRPGNVMSLREEFQKIRAPANAPRGKHSQEFKRHHVQGQRPLGPRRGQRGEQAPAALATSLHSGSEGEMLWVDGEDNGSAATQPPWAGSWGARCPPGWSYGSASPATDTGHRNREADPRGQRPSPR